MAHAEYKGIGVKGQAKFRLYYDAPKKADGSRNQKKESFAIFPLPEKAEAIIKAEQSRKIGTLTKSESILIERFEKKAFEMAELEARNKEQKISSPDYIEPAKQSGEPFIEHSARWLKYKAGTARKGKRQPKTIWRYEQLLQRIDGFFKDDYVENINIDRVEEFYAWLANQPKKPGNRKEAPTKDLGTLSERTQWHYHRCLYYILEYAVARDKLASNPCRHVRPHTVPEDIDEKKPDAYNIEQVAEINRLMEREYLKYRALVAIALEIGPRPEEILALKWVDIDFDTRMVDFNKTWQYLPKQGSFEKPYLKNKSSRRKVRLSASTVFLLRQLKGEQESESERLGSKWIDSGAVFVNWCGKQVGGTWATCWWRGWIRKQAEQNTDLPIKTLYSLRHTCISLLISSGANPLEIANMVGHANAEMLWRVYGHPTQKENFNGADIMEKIMNNKAAQAQSGTKVEHFIQKHT